IDYVAQIIDTTIIPHLKTKYIGDLEILNILNNIKIKKIETDNLSKNIVHFELFDFGDITQKNKHFLVFNEILKDLVGYQKFYINAGKNNLEKQISLNMDQVESI